MEEKVKVNVMAVKRGRECGSDGGEVEYEKLRNERLRENQKRMEELGLLSLSKSLSESARGPGFRGSPRTPSSTPRPIVPAGPARRSSRYVFFLIHEQKTLKSLPLWPGLQS